MPAYIKAIALEGEFFPSARTHLLALRVRIALRVCTELLDTLKTEASFQIPLFQVSLMELKKGRPQAADFRMMAQPAYQVRAFLGRLAPQSPA